MTLLDSEALRGIANGHEGPFGRRWKRAHESKDIEFQPDIHQKVVVDPQFQGDTGIIYQSNPGEVTVCNIPGDPYNPKERAVTRRVLGNLRKSTEIRVNVYDR